MNIPYALSGTVPIVDLNPRLIFPPDAIGVEDAIGMAHAYQLPVSTQETTKDKAEAYIGKYGCSDFPYSLHVESSKGNVLIGTYKRAQEAADAIPAHVTTCHWFIKGKGKS